MRRRLWEVNARIYVLVLSIAHLDFSSWSYLHVGIREERVRLACVRTGLIGESMNASAAAPTDGNEVRGRENVVWIIECGRAGGGGLEYKVDLKVQRECTPCVDQSAGQL